MLSGRPSLSSRVLPVLGVSSFALFASCTDDAQMTSRFASDFTRGKHTISVFGVYRDGRMSAEAWESLGPSLSAPFGSKLCDEAFSAPLAAANPPLAASIDDVTRANGVGEDLLERIAPAATGDLIVVFTVAGHVGKQGPAPASSGASSMGGGAPATGRGGGGAFGRGGAGRMGMGGSGAMARTPVDLNVFEVSASFYSVPLHRSVGLVAMQYTGASADEAMRKLGAELSGALRGSSCSGWNWPPTVDEHRIRELME